MRNAQKRELNRVKRAAKYHQAKEMNWASLVAKLAVALSLWNRGDIMTYIGEIHRRLSGRLRMGITNPPITPSMSSHLLHNIQTTYCPRRRHEAEQNKILVELERRRVEYGEAYSWHGQWIEADDNRNEIVQEEAFWDLGETLINSSEPLMIPMREEQSPALEVSEEISHIANALLDEPFVMQIPLSWHQYYERLDALMDARDDPDSSPKEVAVYTQSIEDYIDKVLNGGIILRHLPVPIPLEPAFITAPTFPVVVEEDDEEYTPF